MTIDPLFSHLLEIASHPASEGVILGGGYGIRVKQVYLREQGARTAISTFPLARATQDLDLFLQMALFLQAERGKALRMLLDQLNYQELTPKWQFSKPFDAAQPDIKVRVDLLSRTPSATEKIRVRHPRVGVGTGINLHSYNTPEAFAVEDAPLRIPISGVLPNGSQVEANILVPHPYASLNMKLKAAHDWLRRERGEMEEKKNSERHVFDLYLLIAMMTEAELEEAAGLATRYSSLLVAREICENAKELFGDKDAQGVVGMQRQLKDEINYSLFWEALSRSLRIQH